MIGITLVACAGLVEAASSPGAGAQSSRLRPEALRVVVAQNSPPEAANPNSSLFSPTPMTGASPLAPSTAPAPAATAPSQTPSVAPTKPVKPAKRQAVPAAAPAKPAKKQAVTAPATAKPVERQAAPTPTAKPAAATPAPAPAAKPAAAVSPSQLRATAPLAVATSSATPSADLNAVKQAIDAARRNKFAQADDIAKSVSDPLARKLIEWVILRDEDNDADFSRYAAFVSANPSWPGIALFRRRAEASLWQDRADPSAVRAFFTSAKPATAKGRLALARSLLAQGDRSGAQNYVRETWRTDDMSRELEIQVFELFGALLAADDHKARMDRRLYAEDVDGGLRQSARLNGVQQAVAKARAAVIKRAANAGKLLDAVPAEGRRDTGYIFSRIQWLRRDDKIAEAAQLMISAPRDPAAIVDVDEWWVERKLIARKLLDLKDARTAYLVVRDAAPPTKGENKVDHHFTAGWIALRFLNDPANAATHFARIAQVTVHPAGLARAGYWLGRAAEAQNKPQDAKAQYEQAARYSTTYYGQLARARLGMSDIVLNSPPEPDAATRASLAKLEIARAMEILYAIGERDFVVPIMAEMTDRTNDVRALAALADVAARNEDARALVLLGRSALGRGLPFDVHAYPVTGLPRYTPIGPKVEPAVAYAIARQESGFHPRAVSKANALGLMQVTPAAGRTIAKKFNVTFNQKRLLDDPVYNMQMGSAELGDLLTDLRGSYILSFVAYNAGRRRVTEWTERYGDPRDPKIDPIDWVERIPFTETRNYVQRVLENLQVYRMRFGGSPKLLIEADLRRGGTAN
ncbi:MAG: lytic transglycosylase domain-containing protein [Rhizobiales bacterium]|nr:lytic transglycosylase domain-containing protein [Hyphomicrobiales bacterium]